MAKEKLEDLSIEQLRKRKKFASIMVGILISVFGLSVIIIVLKYLDIGYWGKSSTLVPGLVCFLMAVGMYMRIRRINEELKNRWKE